MIHSRRLHAFEAVRPGRRVYIAHCVANPFLFGVKFDMLACGNFESNTLACRLEFACRNVIYFTAELRNGLR